MKLFTERLHIRPISIADKHDILEYRSDSEANKYQGWVPKNMHDVEEFIKNLAPQPNSQNTWFQLAIIEQKSNQLVGDIGIHFLESENKQVEIGFTLDKNYHGNGFANEALKCVIDYIFGELKKHRISASVDPNNIKSIRLLERIGFRKEAHFVESLYLNGKWVDDVIYAMLWREWKNAENIPLQS